MTKKDIKEFDRIITMCESQNQMDRIKGRLLWSKFSDRFTLEELHEAWEKIK